MRSRSLRLRLHLPHLVWANPIVLAEPVGGDSNPVRWIGNTTFSSKQRNRGGTKMVETYDVYKLFGTASLMIDFFIIVLIFLS
jgi:hypothetical protein